MTTDETGSGAAAIALVSAPPACFVSGTRIRTTRGEIAVEALAVGDLVVTAAGDARPIVRLGSQTIRKPGREHLPVRIKARAFPGDVPRRDLRLSPDHTVCVRALDEVLVPISQLINGATVDLADANEVTYWHVELEGHDVLLAEGLGCESSTVAAERHARPLVERGAVVAVIRQRLHSRAESMGWRREKGMDPHLIVDGRRIEPTVDGDLAAFVFPADAREAILASRTWVPADDGASRDRRTLGLSVRGLAVLDGLRVDRQIPLDEVPGFHQGEAADGRPWRWTNGQLPLPSRLWADCRGHVILRLSFAPDAGRSWTAPPRRSREPRRNTLDAGPSGARPGAGPAPG